MVGLGHPGCETGGDDGIRHLAPREAPRPRQRLPGRPRRVDGPRPRRRRPWPVELCDRRRGLGADGLISAPPRRRRADGGVDVVDAPVERRRQPGRDERQRHPLPRPGPGPAPDVDRASLRVATDAGVRTVMVHDDRRHRDGPGPASTWAPAGPVRRRRRRWPSGWPTPATRTVDIGNPHLVLARPRPGRRRPGVDGQLARAAVPRRASTSSSSPPARRADALTCWCGSGAPASPRPAAPAPAPRPPPRPRVGHGRRPVARRRCPAGRPSARRHRRLTVRSHVATSTILIADRSTPAPDHRVRRARTRHRRGRDRRPDRGDFDGGAPASSSAPSGSGSCWSA